MNRSKKLEKPRAVSALIEEKFPKGTLFVPLPDDIGDHQWLSLHNLEKKLFVEYQASCTISIRQAREEFEHQQNKLAHSPECTSPTSPASPGQAEVEEGVPPPEETNEGNQQGKDSDEHEGEDESKQKIVVAELSDDSEDEAEPSILDHPCGRFLVLYIAKARLQAPPPPKHSFGSPPPSNVPLDPNDPANWVYEPVPFNFKLNETGDEYNLDFTPSELGSLQINIAWMERSKLEVLLNQEEEEAAEMQAIVDGVRNRKDSIQKRDVKPLSTQPSSPQPSVLAKATVMSITREYQVKGDWEEEVTRRDGCEVDLQPLFGGSQHIEVVAGTRYTLTPKGGCLKLDGLKMTFPEGAVDKTVQLSVHKKVMQGLTWKKGFTTMALRSPIIACLPHNLEFNEPVHFELDYECISRYPKPAVGRLCFLYWPDEGASWTEMADGRFRNGKGVVDIHHFSCYGVGSKSMTDASLMPVLTPFVNRADFLHQSKKLYENILPLTVPAKGCGGHVVLSSLSFFKDKKKPDRHLYPPVTFGFVLGAQGKPDSIYSRITTGKLELLGATAAIAERGIILKLRNLTSQPLVTIAYRGSILEQAEWTAHGGGGHDHIVMTKDTPLELKGLQEGLFRVAAMELTGLLQPTKTDELSITPFVLEKPEMCKTVVKLHKYMATKFDD